MGSPLPIPSNVRLATPFRYILPVILLFVTLHYIREFTHHDAHGGALTSLSNSWKNASLDKLSGASGVGSLFGLGSSGSNLAKVPPTTSPSRRANAAIVMLARNSELNAVASSMKQFEDRFNHKYNYPWVLLNDEPFTEEFIKRTTILASTNVSYGVIPSEHWNQPEWIDEKKAKAGRDRLVSQNIIYGGSVSYRNMCRFNSGFFYRHELLKPYRYYWRVEPGVSFFCDMDYDPFLMMQDEGKVYGFTISLYEWHPTIPTLWSTVKQFMKDHPEHIAPDNAMHFLSDNGGDTYNLCHFWSNFEIADMDFWRSEAYSTFFDYLDNTGGFYYERWGDAPVHSIGAALLANKSQVHFFRDIGYRHPPFQRCPQGALHSKGKCWCDPGDSFDYRPNSCILRWETTTGAY